MRAASKRSLFKNVAIWVLTCLALAGCAGEDKPFSLVGGSDGPGGNPSGNTPPGGGTPDGCFVNFNGTMQLKISAHPPSGAPIEKLDAQKVTLQPIPIKAEGGNLTLRGDTFPQIILTTVNDAVDLRISGIPGTSAGGTYDSATGAIQIDDFQFALEILTKGTTEPFVDGKETLSGVDFTTGSVTANGNLNPITETGSPVDPGSKAMAMVIGITLPDQFTTLNLLDSRIGGGALTAKFEGTLDQLPDQCTGGTPGGGTGGGGGPSEFAVSEGSSAKITSLDFGNTPVVITAHNGKTILDCKDALNRGIINKTLTITNTGEGERKFSFIRGADTDSDPKDPLCSGAAEFVRGSISATGGATCQTVSVAGKDFNTDVCTLPAGQAGAKLMFPVMYAPFNFVLAPEGGTQPTDTGVLNIGYDDGKTFGITLKGKSEPDTRDVFGLSKIKEGVVSPKQIKNKGLIKIPLQTGDPQPFTQRMALLNSGTDAWEEIKAEIVGGTAPVFSVPALPSATLAASDGVAPSKTEFDLVFDPGSDSSYNETLKITMLKAGSKTSDNPAGDVTTLTFSLSGTVGIPVLSGNVKFQIDFQAAKIDHSITVDPVESLDFRAHSPDQSPPPMAMTFADTDVDSIKEVALNTVNTDLMTMSLAERKNTLRILNAQATVGLSGNKLIPGDGSDKCNEAPNINVPYDDSKRECSYFYFNIFGDNPGVYDDDTGELTIPDITLRLQNPHHSDIAGKWPRSNPSANPSYILDTTLNITLTTRLLDKVSVTEGEEEIVLVPDDRISGSDLNVKNKAIGKDCVEDFLNHDPSVGTIEAKHPHLKCYLSTGDRYLQGLPASLRPNQLTDYDVVLVGVGRFPPETTDPSLPWFMGENGGSRLYVAIQGRLFKE